MNITRHPENSVSWIDLGTPDTETTTAFYTALFGWTVAPPDPNGYRLCTLRGQLVAALAPAEDAGAPYWTINITVSDIQATATHFTNLGAQIIVAPTEVGTLGHYAVALDPIGAPLSLWQPGTHTGMQLNHEPGTFAGISLLTDHSEQAAVFYRPALHWNSNPEHTEFRLPDNSIAAASPPPGKPTETWSCAIPPALCSALPSTPDSATPPERVAPGNRAPSCMTDRANPRVDRRLRLPGQPRRSRITSEVRGTAPKTSGPGAGAPGPAEVFVVLTLSPSGGGPAAGGPAGFSSAPEGDGM